MREKRSGAQYMLRLDDLCPTMDRARWSWFAELIDHYELKPILAVVPDNRDPELVRDTPDTEFWHKMRRMESEGATIGLHGLRHQCHARGRSFVGLHGQSEFAGVAYAAQREWIRAGLRILRSHWLEPRVWVAPRHGFDGATCRALRANGIEIISDGWAQRPFRRRGLTWLPQQLWGPVAKSAGLWTICMHPNTAREQDVEALRSFLDRHASQFTGVNQVLRDWVPEERTFQDHCFQWRIAATRRAKLWFG